MFTSRIKTEFTSRRLNAEYYDPSCVSDENLFANWRRQELDLLRKSNAPIVYGVLKPDSGGTEFRLAKAENFQGMFVTADDCKPISEQMFF